MIDKIVKNFDQLCSRLVHSTDNLIFTVGLEHSLFDLQCIIQDNSALNLHLTDIFNSAKIVLIGKVTDLSELEQLSERIRDHGDIKHVFSFGPWIYEEKLLDQLSCKLNIDYSFSDTHIVADEFLAQIKGQ